MALFKAEGFFIGVDVGTQGTKSIIMNARDGSVVYSSRADYPLIEKPDGTREQKPQDWVDAVRKTIGEIVEKSGVKREEIRGIGISGQQHGLVPLDEKGRVIRNAKLWNDTTTEAQCRILTEKLGGLEKVLKLTGNAILPGYTLPKVLWLKENEPGNYKRLETILLPHDYINFYLTGEKRAECGDASGTAYFDVRGRKWSEEVLKAVDDERDLMECLPTLIESVEPCGFVRKEVLEDLGLPSDAKLIVSSGGGDNMMGAIGTGNTKPGVVTVSLGTSGTVYAYSDFPVVDSKGEFAAFCDSTGGWLPLACTMNVTVATELVKRLFELDNTGLERFVESAPPGCDGLILLPYFVGERTPNLPSATGVFFGINEFTMKGSHLARAAMEGATLGIRYGLESMKKEGIKPSDIRLTGGGSKSTVWQQTAADIFNTPTVTMEIDEAASYGAAIQALWCYLNYNGDKVKISEITDSFVKTRNETLREPRKEYVERYEKLYKLQVNVTNALRESFDIHREYLRSLQ